jgi:TRAP-type C4-dicarboxylate transport system permease small subunit
MTCTDAEIVTTHFLLVQLCFFAIPAVLPVPHQTNLCVSWRVDFLEVFLGEQTNRLFSMVCLILICFASIFFFMFRTYPIFFAKWSMAEGFSRTLTLIFFLK